MLYLGKILYCQRNKKIFYYIIQFNLFCIISFNTIFCGTDSNCKCCCTQNDTTSSTIRENITPFVPSGTSSTIRDNITPFIPLGIDSSNGIYDVKKEDIDFSKEVYDVKNEDIDSSKEVGDVKNKGIDSSNEIDDVKNKDIDSSKEVGDVKNEDIDSSKEVGDVKNEDIDSSKEVGDVKNKDIDSSNEVDDVKNKDIDSSNEELSVCRDNYDFDNYNNCEVSNSLDNLKNKDYEYNRDNNFDNYNNCEVSNSLDNLKNKAHQYSNDSDICSENNKSLNNFQYSLDDKMKFINKIESDTDSLKIDKNNGDISLNFNNLCNNNNRNKKIYITNIDSYNSERKYNNINENINSNSGDGNFINMDRYEVKNDYKNDYKNEFCFDVKDNFNEDSESDDIVFCNIINSLNEDQFLGEINISDKNVNIYNENQDIIKKSEDIKNQDIIKKSENIENEVYNYLSKNINDYLFLYYENIKAPDNSLRKLTVIFDKKSKCIKIIDNKCNVLFMCDKIPTDKNTDVSGILFKVFLKDMTSEERFDLILYRLSELEDDYREDKTNFFYLIDKINLLYFNFFDNSYYKLCIDSNGVICIVKESEMDNDNKPRIGAIGYKSGHRYRYKSSGLFKKRYFWEEIKTK